MAKPKGKIVATISSPFPDAPFLRYANQPHLFVRFYKSAWRAYALRELRTADEGRALKLLPELYREYLADPDEKRREDHQHFALLVDKWIRHQECTSGGRRSLSRQLRASERI